MTCCQGCWAERLWDETSLTTHCNPKNRGFTVRLIQHLSLVEPHDRLLDISVQQLQVMLFFAKEEEEKSKRKIPAMICAGCCHGGISISGEDASL